MEIVRFLEQPARWEQHRLFAAGRRFARLTPGRRRLALAGEKGLHLGLAALAGCLVIFPVLLGLLWLVQYAWLRR